MGATDGGVRAVIYLVGNGAVARYYRDADGVIGCCDVDESPPDQGFSEFDCLVCIGDNRKRKLTVGRLIREGYNVLDDYLDCPGSLVVDSARIAWHALIHGHVDHDCVVAAFASTGPGSVLCGRVRIDEGATIGAGATVCQDCHVGAWATVGAGCVLPPGTMVPAGETWVARGAKGERLYAAHPNSVQHDVATQG